MKNVTLKQGNQVLNLVLQKDVPREQLQELLASGLLADLLDANIQQVDRIKFREVLGLSIFKYDQTKNGWKLLKDVPFDGKKFVPEFVEFLKPGESNMHGKEMKRRAKTLNVHTGQKHAEYLLEHQDRIPKELRGMHLVFPDTVWLSDDGLHGVPCLGWSGGECRLVFGWLELGWGGDVRLVSSRE